MYELKKILDIGIDFSTNADVMKQNLVKWLDEFKKDKKLFFLIDEVLDFVGEPFIFRFDFPRIDVYIPKNFVAGKIRMCILHKNNGYFLQTDEHNDTLLFIDHIMKSDLVEANKTKKFKNIEYYHIWQWSSRIL